MCLLKDGVRKSIPRPLIVQASPDIKVERDLADRIQMMLPVAFRLRAHNGSIPPVCQLGLCASTFI